MAFVAADSAQTVAAAETTRRPAVTGPAAVAAAVTWAERAAAVAAAEKAVAAGVSAVAGDGDDAMNHQHAEPAAVAASAMLGHYGALLHDEGDDFRQHRCRLRCFAAAAHLSGAAVGDAAAADDEPYHQSDCHVLAGPMDDEQPWMMGGTAYS